MRRRKASSSSKRTASRAATSSGRRERALARPGPRELLASRGKSLRDVVAPGLKVLFVGINPGLYSAATGHHFARPGNRFWPALHAAGFTRRRLAPSEQRRLLESGYGVTNLVNRATAAAEELGGDEFLLGARRLSAKVRRYRPAIVAFLGLGAYRLAFGARKPALGPQPARLEGATVWVLPNPSGLNANYQLPELVRLFKSLWKAAQAHGHQAR